MENKKKKRKIEENSELNNEQQRHLFAALCIVRESALYNTILQRSDCWISAMCILAVWDQINIVFIMNKIGEKYKLYEKYMERWKNRFKTNHEDWEELAHSMPLGKKYIEAVTSGRWNLNHISKELIDYINYNEYHKYGFSKALTLFAEKECLDKGTFARDQVKIEKLRGVHDQSLLKAAGSQLL